MPRPSLKNALLAAGLSQFHQHGYNATSVAQIAAAAGTPKGSFYNHFASKEAFAVEILGAYAAEGCLEMLADKTVPSDQRITRHFEFLREQHRAHDFERGCLLGNFAADLGPDTALLQAATEEAFGAWIGALDSALQAEDPHAEPRDSGRIASAMLDGWEGALLRSKATGDKQAVDNFVDFVLPALLRHP